MKRCPECGEIKPLDAFHRNSSTPDGRQAWCRECMIAYQHRMRDARRIPSARRQKYPKLYDQGWLEQRYLRDLLTVKEIAGMVGCSPASVYIALRQLGISTMPHGVRTALRARVEAQRQEVRV